LVGKQWAAIATFLNFFMLACLAPCSGLPFCLTSARFPANLAPLRMKERTPGCVLRTQNTTHSYKSALCFLNLYYSLLFSPSFFILVLGESKKQNPFDY
jgi:hypothetical protein